MPPTSSVPALSAPPVRRSCCQQCGSDRVLRLDLCLTDGTPVVFLSCRGCEQRSYEGPEGGLAVGDVLARTVKPGKGSVPERSRG